MLTNGPEDAPHRFLFAHGAGAGMDASFMNEVAEALGDRGIRVVRFEFPYMAARRISGKRGGPPDRQPVLLDSWRRVIEEHGGGSSVVIGGKSMGGRMASLVADEVGARGLLCFGYPFHPPGKPEQVRTAHLAGLRTPALILQGTRDIFGGPDEVAGYELSPSIHVEWIDGGDHSLYRSARDQVRFLRVVEQAASFIRDLGLR